MNTQQLQNLLCETLCAQANVSETRPGLWRVDTPFTFPDGDAYSLYVQQLPSGGVRISDMGSTLMHLSYENDIEKFREGSRGRLFHQILAEGAVDESGGEFYIEAPISELGHGVFHFGQTLTRIHDLTFLNRLRVESTFYEDLRETLKTIVDVERLHEVDFDFECAMTDCSDVFIDVLAFGDEIAADFKTEHIHPKPA